MGLSTARLGATAQQGGARRPKPSKDDAALPDVAGEDEGTEPEAFDSGAKGDTTALTIVEAATTGRALTEFRAVDRRAWTAAKHTALHGQFVDLARNV